MNLIDALKLYCHIMQRVGGGLDGRKSARDELLVKGVSFDVIDVISSCVSNDGRITSGNGSTYALTQIGTS